MTKISQGLADRVQPQMRVQYGGNEMSLLDALCLWAVGLLSDPEHLDLRFLDRPLLSNLIHDHASIKPAYDKDHGWLCGTLELEIDPNATLGLPSYVYGSGDEKLEEYELAAKINEWLKVVMLDVLSPSAFLYLGENDGAMTLREAAELSLERLAAIHKTHICLNAHRASFQVAASLYDDFEQDLKAAADFFGEHPDGVHGPGGLD